jgi:hypothetical protein
MKADLHARYVDAHTLWEVLRNRWKVCGVLQALSIPLCNFGVAEFIETHLIERPIPCCEPVVLHLTFRRWR